MVARLTATYDVDDDRCRAEISTILGQLTAEGLVEKVQ
ncbi:PqqD family peptide modification chaperone [Rhizobium johnstonii]